MSENNAWEILSGDRVRRKSSRRLPVCWRVATPACCQPVQLGAQRMLIYFVQNPVLSDDLAEIEMIPV